MKRKMQLVMWIAKGMGIMLDYEKQKHIAAQFTMWELTRIYIAKQRRIYE
jgi:hypothetical protein